MIKYTADRPQSLVIQGVERHFPPDCQLTLNLVSLHTDPKSWGEDALVWKPARFIETGASIGDEVLTAPSDGSFQPWVSGPRVCPGKKFAQVEFVAVIATLLRNHRVSVESLVGETEEQKMQRVLDVAEDSQVGISPVLKMNHPEKIRLVWERKL
jgi:cytochrome P450